mmetsp:Transcript_23773/g.57336  ORF Transcript_23773/g.57336 Transcript_23773/m.57336 type:complete len:119 (-) Transcript_23773:499-855(-)
MFPSANNNLFTNKRISVYCNLTPVIHRKCNRKRVKQVQRLPKIQPNMFTHENETAFLPFSMASDSTKVNSRFSALISPPYTIASSSSRNPFKIIDSCIRYFIDGEDPNRSTVIPSSVN